MASDPVFAVNNNGIELISKPEQKYYYNTVMVYQNCWAKQIIILVNPIFTQKSPDSYEVKHLGGMIPDLIFSGAKLYVISGLNIDNLPADIYLDCNGRVPNQLLFSGFTNAQLRANTEILSRIYTIAEMINQNRQNIESVKDKLVPWVEKQYAIQQARRDSMHNQSFYREASAHRLSLFYFQPMITRIDAEQADNLKQADNSEANANDRNCCIM